MSKTKIIYNDIAPDAAENASVSTQDALDRSDPSTLPFGAEIAPVLTGGLNAWGLDGTFHAIDGQPIAFWSAEASGADCLFTSPPSITIEFDQLYSSVGVTLTFDTAAGEYCSSVNIKWYQGATLREDADFAPNATKYFCKKHVTSYNKIVLTLNKTKHPHRMARLNQILFGVVREFGMTEIRKASIINDMDLISLEVPISTLKWTLDGRADADYMFQLKQPVEVRNDDRLLGVYYIDGSKRTAGAYEVDCHDAFGVLAEIPFSGGVYSGKSAKTLLEEILDGDFELLCEAEDTALTGAILPCTKREAAQQVLFAWGVCAATDTSDKVRVFFLPSSPSEIVAGRTYPGASVETAAVVTRVMVTAHTYAQDDSGSVEIGGVRYSDTETVYTVTNPNVTANDKQNVVEVTGATLVSTAIGQATAQRVYDHYAKRNTHKAKIVWQGEKIGACVTLPNAWGGTNTGNVAKMEISLSNTVAASCETVGV